MSYTINPNAKNKWARNAENTMDLSLETDASSVYLDNGRTLEQEIGEGSMVSNVATVNSAMSKVIDGTLDGAYESGVMYGRSLVNIKKTVEAITMTGSGQYKGFHLRSIDMIQDLKTDTDYLFVVNVTSNTLEGSTQYSLDFGNTDPNNPNQQAYFTARHYLPYNALGTYKFVLRTKSSFENAVFVSRNQILPSCTGGSITFSYMLLEYQEGMENWDIPFFEGLCDVKMPILRNTGKNLFDGELIRGNISGGGGEDINNAGFESKMCRTNYIKVTPGSNFTASIEGKYVIEKVSQVDKDKKFIATTEKNIPSISIKLSNNTSFIRCVIKSSDSSEITLDDVRNSNIQFEESPTKTSYEPHKSNILHTPEEVVLRSLPNGVCDTLNLNTGEYVQRIGEVIKNNATGFRLSTGGWENKSNVCTFENFKPEGMKVQVANNKPTLNCDKVPSNTFSVQWQNSEGIESITQHNGGNIVLSITREKLSTQDVNGLNTYLQSNPITVQYELAEPITTIVEPLTIPFAYQNGHIILESGYEGQSLLPTLEYSTVINKTGLVESVAKTIQRQEKQLTMLEKMLIQNIINLDYNNTLLTLKNEMEEML